MTTSKLTSIFEIEPGRYEIGCDTISQASPRHFRQISRRSYISVKPVSWAEFEAFVVSGEFAESASTSSNTSTPFRSLDHLIECILEASLEIETEIASFDHSKLEMPVTGLTFFEAARLAEFFGARLVSEIEWEIALGALSTHASMPMKQNINVLQEWTADVFSPQYWRADFASSGLSWKANSDSLVTVRGSTSEDIHQHLCNRRGALPDERNFRRTFRLAWDRMPQNPHST